MEVKIYFDYTCPYCRIANENVHRYLLKYAEISYNWRPWEILPETPPEGIHLEFDSVGPSLARLAEEAGLWMRPPSIQPNSHLPLMGFFYAKEHGKSQEYNDAVFNALWNNDENIGKLGVLSRIVGSIGLEIAKFKHSMDAERDKYEQMLATSESEAIKDGIKLAPTFLFGDKRIVGNVPTKQIERFIKQITKQRKFEEDKL